MDGASELARLWSPCFWPIWCSSSWRGEPAPRERGGCGQTRANTAATPSAACRKTPQSAPNAAKQLSGVNRNKPGKVLGSHQIPEPA